MIFQLILWLPLAWASALVICAMLRDGTNLFSHHDSLWNAGMAAAFLILPWWTVLIFLAAGQQ